VKVSFIEFLRVYKTAGAHPSMQPDLRVYQKGKLIVVTYAGPVLLRKERFIKPLLSNQLAPFPLFRAKVKIFKETEYVNLEHHAFRNKWEK
jgi:hypothetical protein